MAGRLGARLLLALVWLLHWLPLPLLAAIGSGLGRLLHRFASRRRGVALRNVELCMPELPVAERREIVREHFRWLARSLLERGLLWHASPKRLRRLIRVEGDIGFAERHPGQAVMWLVPHFVGMDVAGVASQLFQRRNVATIYQRQRNAVFDAAILRGRSRFGQGEVFSRHDRVGPLVRAIRRGTIFFNLPDMDFGLRDAAFVPFFGVPAATLLAPSRLARSLQMAVQPVLTEMLPGGRGYVVRVGAPWTDWPGDDALADAARMNAWIEQEVRRCPGQYLWVHKRFKTRPPGQPSVYR
ncbi:MAG TPA: lipid A biosynthesis acyltransferase [Rubrivivax sp.]|nr:lipid A biosynthesis acyltransferase [Burkholderiales bacterium]HNT39073.1 lipid A biosynthesis acyltransferase [Rubrivivax sp.]